VRRVTHDAPSAATPQRPSSHGSPPAHPTAAAYGTPAAVPGPAQPVVAPVVQDATIPPQQPSAPAAQGYAPAPQQGYPPAPQQGYAPAPQQPYAPDTPQQGHPSQQPPPGYRAYQGHGYHQPSPVQVGAPGAAMAPPQGPPPWAVPYRKPIVLEIVVVIVGGLLASAFVALMALSTSGAAIGVAILLALVPLVMLVAVVLWIDRWEPEPRFLLVAALLWGGGVAVALASLLNSVVGPAVAGLLGLDMDPDSASAVFGAPVVEELGKGLGILLIFLLRRREFNGPVDGVVYGAVIATGFAVVEDIQYFALSADQVGSVFVMRALLSPFGHLIYTVPMGIALGLASRHRSRLAWLWLLPLGYVVAVGLHMAWNGSLGFAYTLGDIVLIFVLLNWLPFALLAALVIWLRRREAGVVATRLRDYVPSGWLGDGEVQGLASLRGRAQARRWATRFGAGAAMRAYQRAATGLAYARQDLYTGHAGNRARVDEMVQLESMARARAELMARSAPRGGMA
jgi:protease PrsW